MSLPFGEYAVLNSGQRVHTPWNTTGCYVGTTFLAGPHLRMPDAALDSQGRVWIAATGQQGGVHVCCTAAAVWWRAPAGPFGTRVILRTVGDQAEVAYTISATEWVHWRVTNEGEFIQLGRGQVLNGAGGRGMRDWGPLGAPRPLVPLDQVLNGHAVRSAVTAAGATVAIALGDLPVQVVLSKGSALGTLTLGEVDWWTPRVSANGLHWVGVDFAHTAIRGGPVPATVPPLQTGPTQPPIPPEPPTMSAKATIDSFETPIRRDQPSKAVARVTQGDPEGLRWQWQLGGKWHTGADNPASDLDHSYNKWNENLPDPKENMFPGPGRYPIRLQTIVNDAVVDQTGTLRVIEVTADAPGPGPGPGPIPPEPGPTPPTPGPGQIVVHVTNLKTHAPIVGADTWSQITPGTIVKTDRSGYALITASTSGVCTKKDGYHSPGEPQHLETCKVIAPRVELELDPIPPPPPPVPVVHADGRIFRDAANAGWRYKGVSAFQLANRFERGENIQPFLDAYKGYNVLRVWAYTDWTGTGWPRPANAQIVRDFVAKVAQSGFLVEYTFLTNDSVSMSDWAGSFVQELRGTNLLAEIRNEPETHSHSTPTSRLKSQFDASGLVYASGNYEVSAHAFGPYLVAHTSRDDEWPRKAHDLLEYYNGGGPHTEDDPAHKVPCVADEPAKTQDVATPDDAMDTNPLKLTKADDWRAYFGTAALLGAGATFHSETGKYAQLPTDEERTLATAALEGLNAFPADAPNGPYSRPNDNSLRTYCVGPYMVRVRPTTKEPKFTGWMRIGASDVLWRK